MFVIWCPPHNLKFNGIINYWQICFRSKHFCHKGHVQAVKFVNLEEKWHFILHLKNGFSTPWIFFLICHYLVFTLIHIKIDTHLRWKCSQGYIIHVKLKVDTYIVKKINLIIMFYTCLDWYHGVMFLILVSNCVMFVILISYVGHQHFILPGLLLFLFLLNFF